MKRWLAYFSAIFIYSIFIMWVVHFYPIPLRYYLAAGFGIAWSIAIALSGWKWWR